MSATIIDFHTREIEVEFVKLDESCQDEPRQCVALDEKFVGIVNELECLIAQIKAGAVESVAFAFVRPNGTANGYFSESDNVAGLMGAINILQSKLTVDAVCFGDDQHKPPDQAG